MKESTVMKVLVLFTLTCIIFSSCQKDLDTESFINLEDEYEMYISQELSSNGGLASLSIRTTQELGCSNYSIPFQLEISQENIKVVLNKTSLEGVCIAPPSIIKQMLNFGFHNNEKTITIQIQDIVSNSGKIKATDNEISLNLTSNDGIKISKVKINRIKKNMVWGVVQNGTQSSIDKINNLFGSINNGSYVTPGDYGLFYVANSAELQFYDSAFDPAETYVFYTDSQHSDIKTEILKIKESDPSLVFVLTLFDGQTINVE
ncbi:MAG: hypothetical protein ACI86M_002324 [Saprospiraceae bacterium]|jgi:hypothetical protein